MVRGSKPVSPAQVPAAHHSCKHMLDQITSEGARTHTGFDESCTQASGRASFLFSENLRTIIVY